jgi:hypothetical protein
VVADAADGGDGRGQRDSGEPDEGTGHGDNGVMTGVGTIAVEETLWDESPQPDGVM